MGNEPISAPNASTNTQEKKTLSSAQIAQIDELFILLAAMEKQQEYSGKIHPVWFWQTAFKVLYYTGIRRNQLLHVRLKDVCLNSRTIFLSPCGSKTHSENIVPIPDALLPALTAFITKAKRRGLKPSDQLLNVTKFGSNRYKYDVMKDHCVSNCFRELSERLGFAVSPHRLRHTLGTNLMRNPEKNLHLVKEILGHTDIRTTLEYVEPDLQDMKNLLNTMPRLAN